VIRALLKTVAKFSPAEALVFGLAKVVGGGKGNHDDVAQVRDVDAVYLWVNDQDPTWQAKRAEFRPTTEGSVATAKSRFRQFNELVTSIQLLAVNAPFIRKVFIVVDDQQPDISRIIGDLPFEIVLVNHSEFIPSKYLPTFNSRSITSHLHLIPELSERFLYLNDDVFIARKSRVEDWFDGQKLRLRFTETKFPVLESLAENEVLYRARWKCVELAKARGWAVTDQMPEHAAYPLTKSIMKSLWELFPKELEETAAARFRSKDAILPELLAFYFAIGTKLGVPAENSTYKYIPMNEASGILPLIDLALKPNRFLSLCLNDVSEVATGNSISEKALLKRYRRTLKFLEATAK